MRVQKYHVSRNCPEIFIVRFLLKAGMSLHNLKPLSSEFQIEIIPYEKDFLRFADLKSLEEKSRDALAR